LGARYRLSREMIAEALDATMRMEVVVTAEAAFWALERFRLGADFADMVHLIEAQAQEGFHTFDRDMKKQAGPASPVPVDLLP
jgi:predicted nucleic-acid-binding protein